MGKGMGNTFVPWMVLPNMEKTKENHVIQALEGGLDAIAFISSQNEYPRCSMWRHFRHSPIVHRPPSRKLSRLRPHRHSSYGIGLAPGKSSRRSDRGSRHPERLLTQLPCRRPGRKPKRG